MRAFVFDTYLEFRVCKIEIYGSGVVSYEYWIIHLRAIQTVFQENQTSSCFHGGICARARQKVGRDGICYTRGTNTNWCHSLCRLAPGPRPHRDTEKGRRWLFCRALRSRRIMESARTMSSSSSRYVENMAHVQAGEVHVNCPSIMTVSSGKGHTTTLTPTMCRLSLACGTATMVVVARPLCLLDMRGTSIDKAPTPLSGHRVGAMRFVVEHLRTSAFVGTSALSARSMPLSYP